MRIRSLLLLTVAVISTGACSDDEALSDASVPVDARIPIDAPSVDAALDIDAAIAIDASVADADPPDADASVTVTLPAMDDATICSDGNAIGDGSLFVGVSDDGVVRRAFVRFDLSSIPAGATIAEARLDLQVNLRMGTVTANAHRVTTDWNEGATVGTGTGGGKCGTPSADDATWTTTGLGGNWTTAGGDFESVATGSVVLMTTTVALIGLEADVTAWKSGTSNFGWVLVATDEATNQNAARIVSPPNLVVRYFPP